MASATPDLSNYLVLVTSDPSDVYTYEIENISIKDNTYTIDEIDALLARFRRELKEMIDKVIVMSVSNRIPDPNDTSLWLEIVGEDELSGGFNNWYHHNSHLSASTSGT